MGERLIDKRENTTLNHFGPYDVKFFRGSSNDFNYRESGYGITEPIGLVSTVDQRLRDYSSFTNPSSESLTVEEHIGLGLDDVTIGTISTWEREMWKEASVEGGYCDLKDVINGPEWDVDPAYASSFSSDKSPTVTGRLILSPHKEVLQCFRKSGYKVSSLPGKIPLYEFENLGRGSYKNVLEIILIQ